MKKIIEQHYSKIALKYLKEKSKKDGIDYTMICYGNKVDIENLFVLFSNKTSKLYDFSYKFKYVMDRLDKESQENNALFIKDYLHYLGLNGKSTRCFVLKQY